MTAIPKSHLFVGPRIDRLSSLSWLTSALATGCAYIGLLTTYYTPAALLAMVLGLISIASAVSRLLGPGSTNAAESITRILLQLISIAFSASVLSEALRAYGGKLAVLHYAGYGGVPVIYPYYVGLLLLTMLAAIPLPASRLDEPIRLPGHRSAVAILLLVPGAVGLAITLSESRVDAFASRGDGSGQGAVTLAYWSAAVGVAYVVAQGRFSRRSMLIWGLAALEFCGLLSIANRTPIILIVCALLYRLMLERPRALAGWLPAVAIIGVVLASYLSVWRGRVRDGLTSDVAAVLQAMFRDPIGSFLNLGVDSVDGYFLAGRLIRNGFQPQPFDPLLAVLNFIPRAIWESKPILLGSRIGVDYLGFSSGGIFLSGPGYMALVTGGVILGALLYVLVILVTRLLLTKSGDRPWVVVPGIFFCATFTVAGDAFNLFLAVQAGLLWWLAVRVASIMHPREVIPAEVNA